MVRVAVVWCIILAALPLLLSALCTPRPFRLMGRRRSRRLQGQAPANNDAGEELNRKPPRTTTTKRKAAPSRDTSANQKEKKKQKQKTVTLPRTLEHKIMMEQQDGRVIVVGVDEAGRGPLAGPVVAAAVHLSTSTIEGIVDSKQITREDAREALYEAIVHPNKGVDDDDGEVQWAIAIVDAPTIDRVNILQATLLGMRWAVQTVMGQQPMLEGSGSEIPIYQSASIEHDGCYVVTNQVLHKSPTSPTEKDAVVVSSGRTTYHALIDGPHLPADMPCPADAVVRGDAREYCIAAAAILAKVTRDRLLRSYAANLYPAYGLERHKGYPTKAHVQALRQHGPTPIHRRSFAPLKQWAKDAQAEDDNPGETKTAEE